MANISFDDLIPQASTPKPAPQPTKAGGKPQEASGPLQAFDDIMRLTANGMTGGYADKASAWLNDKVGYDEKPRGLSDLVTGQNAGSRYDRNLEAERAATEEAAKRAGWAGTIAETAGAIAAPGKVAQKVTEGAARLVPRLPVIGPMLTNSWGQAATQGAELGAFNAAGHDQGIGEGIVEGAASGVGGKALANGIVGTVKGAASLMSPKPYVPTTEQINAAKRAMYQRAEREGGVINAPSFSGLVNDLQGIAADFGHDPAIEPKVGGFFNVLNRYNGNDQTMKSLDTLRKVAGRSWKGSDSDRELGRRLVAKIDEYTGGVGPHDFIPGLGDPAAADAAFKAARSLAQRSAKAKAIDAALEKGDRRTMKTGVGGNEDNVIRQNVDKLLERNNSWTPDERAALEETVLGHAPGASKYSTRNNARAVGRVFSPVGNSLTASILGLTGLGAAGVGGPAAALPVLAAGGVGFGAKSLADALTRRSAEKAGEIVRAGGRASAVAAPPNAVQRLAEAKRDALARVLMTYGVTARD